MTDTPRGIDLQRTYVVLSDGGRTETLDYTADFWDSVDQREELRTGRLVAVFPYADDWTNWEMHPQADELVILLTGAVDLVFDRDGTEDAVSLRGNEAAVVPAGVWHRAIVHEAGTALHLTRGQGSMYRPV